jgi:hypothetical protein
MITLDDYIEKPYSRLPLGIVLQKYQEEKVNEGFIYKRFENLEMHFMELAKNLRWEIEHREILILKEKKLMVQSANLQKSIRNNKLLKESGKIRHDPFDDIIIPDHGEIDASELENLSDIQKLDLIEPELNSISHDIVIAGMNIQNYLGDVNSFERDLMTELQTVYEKKLVGPAFATMRLMRPGKFRLKEPVLMVLYGILPPDEVYNSEFIESIERELLVRAKSRGSYLIPGSLVKKRLMELPGRIKGLAALIKDAEELKAKYGMGFNPAKSYDLLTDLLYEDEMMKRVVRYRMINLQQNMGMN